ncbi:methyltransferase domain-containing protein [Verrucomicrobia bacterium]|nr:methyltransferase domain-containing protein [Verrucomicrobiota bacterium]
MTAIRKSSFDTVTELPGNKAHIEQIDAMRTRYEWASQYCVNKDVLEIACGAGIGLGLLASKARSVIGGDLDLNVLQYGKDHFHNHNRIQVKELDACNLVMDDASVDVAICFEATYYFPSLETFLTEVRRILRPGGIFLCSSVNSQWHGFNPSPYSHQYHTIEQMNQALEKAGFTSEFFTCFEDDPKSLKRRLIGSVRKIAIALKLVPKTMKGKELLKKIFYGKLDPLPSEMTSAHGKAYSLTRFEEVDHVENFKFYYFCARKSS